MFTEEGETVVVGGVAVVAGVDGGHVLLEEGRKTHRVPLDRIKRAHLDVEF